MTTLIKTDTKLGEANQKGQRRITSRPDPQR